MDKVEIEKILEEFGRNYDDGKCSYCPSVSTDCRICPKMIKFTSSLTALIIKWLEEKEVDIDNAKNSSELDKMFGRNQLITELIGELR